MAALEEHTTWGWRALIRGLALAAALLLPGAAAADFGTVLVSIAEKQRRGVTFRLEGRCYVLAPFRLADHTETPLVTAGGVRSKADLVRFFDMDLIVLEVPLTSGLCASSDFPKIEGLDDALAGISTATLIGRGRDGGVSSTRLAIDGFGEEWVAVSPSEGERRLLPEHGGSVLTDGARAIGVLVSVDPESGTGKVLRMDSVRKLVTSSLSRKLSAVAPGIVGCWSTPPGRLRIREDHTFSVADHQGSWSRLPGGSYELLLPRFINTLSMSGDSKQILGTNNYASKTGWNRVAGPAGRLEGTWKSMFGVLELRSDGTGVLPGRGSVPDTRASWKELRPGVYEISWSHGYIWDLRSIGDDTYIRGRISVGLKEEGVTKQIMAVGPLVGERVVDAKDCPP